MVVMRFPAALILAALAPMAVFGQDDRIQVWVENNAPKVDEPFALHIEVSGAQIGQPTIPRIDGLLLGAPRSSMSTTIINGVVNQEIRLSYRAVATQPGPLTIPAIAVVVDGATRYSKPVRLSVVDKPPVRAWVDQDTVTVNSPFRIFVEGVGKQVTIPPVMAIEGLRLDDAKASKRTAPERRQGQTLTKVFHGLHATAIRSGRITIPALGITVDGKVHKTEPFEITAVEPRSLDSGGNVELFKEDLVLLKNEVSKHEVFQGEPILLGMQLWRIIYRGIDAGPYARANIRMPSTEGFYEVPLEPVSFVRSREPWQYNVTEERRLLYATSIGELTIGSRHWEGVARVPSRNRISLIFRDSYNITLDTEPILITVKPLPERPPDFSGAVGHFVLDANLDADSLLQGVPVKLHVTVNGEGNPDAVGDPRLPDLPWAHVSKPVRETGAHIVIDTAKLLVAKSFVYTITPLEVGDAAIPTIEFTYFDPREEIYKTETAGPFKVNVLRSAETEQRMVVAQDVTFGEQGVAILGEDLHPLMALPDQLLVRRSSSLTLPSVLVAPVVSFILLLGYTARRRRFETDTGFARAYHAKSKGLKNLAAVTQAEDPPEALSHALVAFIADTFNVDETGMTSSDVKTLLEARHVDPHHIDSAVKILRACDRARYASLSFSRDEMRALISAAEACLRQFDGAGKAAKS